MIPLTIQKARHLLSHGLVTSQELVVYCHNLLLAGEHVWGLNAFSQRTSLDELMVLAEQSDERRRHGQALSPLDGIPISIKSNLAVQSHPLTAGSRILGETRKSTPVVGYDATVVKSLKDAGGIIMGTTTMDEFGMGSLGSNTVSGPAKNPLPYLQQIPTASTIELDNPQKMNDPQHTAQIVKSSSEEIHELHHASFLHFTESGMVDRAPGGSSCGSAISVAHGSSLISLGSDTGGSVRLPAAWTGVVGLKPTYGRLSRHGLVSYASSLDTVGILARSSRCVALTLQELVNRSTMNSNKDSNYDVSSPLSCNLLQETNDGPGSGLSGIRIGVPEAFSVKECNDRIRAHWSNALEHLEAQGAVIHMVDTTELSPQILQTSLAAYYVLVSAEASSNLARYDGFRYGAGANRQDALDEWDKFSSETSFSLLEHQFARARSKGLGPEVIRRILNGNAVLSSDRFHTYYEAAAKLRAALTHQMHASLENYDALLVPSSIVSPPPQIDKHMDSMDMYANDVMTVPASLAGLPAVSVPIRVGDDDNDTFAFQPAVQLIGSRMQEGKLLEIASHLQ